MHHRYIKSNSDELETAYTDSDYRDYAEAEQEVRAMLADKSRNGASAQIKELLGKYGAEKLSEVSSDGYAALLKDAEGIENG